MAAVRRIRFVLRVLGPFTKSTLVKFGGHYVLQNFAGVDAVISIMCCASFNILRVFLENVYLRLRWSVLWGL